MTFSGIVVQRRLLLGLDLHDALHKVLVVDIGRVPPQGQHACLHTHRLELRCVEVVRGAGQLLKVDVCGGDGGRPGKQEAAREMQDQSKVQGLGQGRYQVRGRV